MNGRELAEEIIKGVGGKNNVVSVTIGKDRKSVV